MCLKKEEYNFRSHRFLAGFSENGNNNNHTIDIKYKLFVTLHMKNH